MEGTDVMLREELHNMIKSNVSVSEVNSKIDAIMIKMYVIEVVVPEFGTITKIILAIVG